uniref:C-type lectin domain-containing protein n=1 Tax=Capra hircus TaxID=9925 RepID=A0A8C2S428_CAPHI
MESLRSQVPELEQPQDPVEERRPESPENSLSLAPAKEAAGAGQDLSGEKMLPSPRPAPLRLLPPSLGYGAFRRQASTGAEPPSPDPVAAEQPRDGEMPETELIPKAAPGEPAPGAWTPVELQVDVRVKSVGTAGGSCAPSPAPSTRFLTVPVPESPGFSRHASPAHTLLRRTPSPGDPHTNYAAFLTHIPKIWVGPGPPAARCGCDAFVGFSMVLSCDDILTCVSWCSPPPLPGLPMYMRSLRWALAVMAVLLAVLAMAVVALASKTGIRCRPCPQGWMWSEGHCYYLAAEAKAWETSQAFCSAHHATLPLLRHTQDFLSRHPVTKYSWVGARRGPQGWHWIDGTPLPPQLPEEDQDQPDLECGRLEGGKLVASDCASPRPWVCAKGTK